MGGFPVTKELVGNTPVDVRRSPGTITGGWAEVPGALDGYIVFYNKPAAEVSVGNTPPYYYQRCFGFSTAFLTRGAEEITFDNAISVATVVNLNLGGAAPPGTPANIVMIIS